MTGDALAGFGVIVTRPGPQADELIQAIEKVGGHVIRFPVIDIAGRKPDDVAAEFAQLPEPGLVIFISRNAVLFGHAILAGLAAKVAAVGPATARTLTDAGITVDYIPVGGFDSEHLLAHPALQDVNGLSITIVRAESGRELLADTLRSRGAEVNYLTAYERQTHLPDAGELAGLENAFRGGSVQCLSVMSVDSLRNFLQLMPASCHEQLRKTLLVAPSDRVIQTAKEMIPGVATSLAPGPQVTDMVNTLISFRQSGQSE